MEQEQVLKKCTIYLPPSEYPQSLGTLREAYNRGDIAGMSMEPQGLKRGYWNRNIMPVHIRINKYGDQSIETAIRSIEACLALVENVDFLYFDLFLPPDWEDEKAYLADSDRITWVVRPEMKHIMPRILKIYPELPMRRIGWSEDFSSIPIDSKLVSMQLRKKLKREIKIFVPAGVSMRTLRVWDKKLQPTFWDVGPEYVAYL